MVFLVKDIGQIQSCITNLTFTINSNRTKVLFYDYSSFPDNYVQFAEESLNHTASQSRPQPHHIPLVTQMFAYNKYHVLHRFIIHNIPFYWLDIEREFLLFFLLRLQAAYTCMTKEKMSTSRTGSREPVVITPTRFHGPDQIAFCLLDPLDYKQWRCEY